VRSENLPYLLDPEAAEHEFNAFLTWLGRYRGHDTPRGDLCEDVEREVRIRAHRGEPYRSLRALVGHVDMVGCREARRIVRHAVRAFWKAQGGSLNEFPL
jgi:hypothetical protein